MKYISLVIFAALLTWTWSLATTPRDFSLEFYQELQAEFENAIRSQIQTRRPDAKNIIFHQLFTDEMQESGEVRSHFRYQIDASTTDGDTTEEVIEGTATRRSLDNGETWNWHIEEVASPILRFRDGIKVSPQFAEPTHADSKTDGAATK